MRKVMAAGILGFVLGVAVWADTFRPGGTLLPIGLEQALPVPFVAFSFPMVLYTINEGQLGRIPWSRVKPVLAALPIAVWAVMGGLFAATMVNLGASMTAGAGDQLVFTRGFVGNLAWISAGAAALAYGVRRHRAGTPARPQIDHVG